MLIVPVRHTQALPASTATRALSACPRVRRGSPPRRLPHQQPGLQDNHRDPSGPRPAEGCFVWWQSPSLVSPRRRGFARSAHLEAVRLHLGR
jgi:hypothetical protein